jgi:hypothetical protein
MAVNESLDLALIELSDPSGIFDRDLHRVPELQYGFNTPGVKEEVSEQVLKLDSHIRAFTSRNLSYYSDSLNAFLGVAARYFTNNDGLCLLVGMPVWVGVFANRKSDCRIHSRCPSQPGRMLASGRRRTQRCTSWTWAG